MYGLYHDGVWCGVLNSFNNPKDRTVKCPCCPALIRTATGSSHTNWNGIKVKLIGGK
jgi:hypothetical protein